MSKIMGCKTLQKSFQSKYILESLFVIHLYLYVLSDILDTVQKKHFQKRIKKKINSAARILQPASKNSQHV